MLFLTRRIGESIFIGPDISISLVEIDYSAELADRTARYHFINNSAEKNYPVNEYLDFLARDHLDMAPGIIFHHVNCMSTKRARVGITAPRDICVLREEIAHGVFPLADVEHFERAAV